MTNVITLDEVFTCFSWNEILDAIPQEEIESYLQKSKNGAKIDNEPTIRILETNIGPMISESRSSAYDVMEAYDEGSTPSEISQIYNLSPYQVDVALKYIEENRSWMEPKLKEIIKKADARERYYRAIAAEIDRKKSPPMTPKRIALQALIEKNRQARGEL